jgi:ligand-binding sensor domain-containing protein
MPPTAVRVALMCVVIPIATSVGRAQQSGPPLAALEHTTWTIRDGAPAGVRALAQSADGALWIGATTGLYRFDGIQFEPFEAPAGQTLPSLSVSALLAPTDGTLWIGYVWGGVSLLARGRLTHFGERGGLPEGSVTAFARDSAGDIWAATTTGLARLRGDHWQRIGPESGYPGGNTSRLMVDRRGTLWAPTTDGVFALARGTSRFERRAPSLDPAGNGGGTLREAPDGSIWAASTTLGLTSLSDAAGLTSPQATAQRLRKVRGLLVDRHANAWLLDSAGVARVSLAAGPPDPARRLTPESVPVARTRVASGSETYALLEDREGDVWVGTNGGLDRFRETKLTPVIFAGPIVKPALAAADGGSVWVASSANPLVLVDDGVTPIPRAPAEITCTYRDLRGGVWLGGPGGIWYASPGATALGDGFTRVVPPGETGTGDVRAIARSSTGDLWVSVRGERGSGVFRRRGGAWSSVVGPSRSAEEIALTIVADSEGRTWLGYPRNRLVLAAGDSTHTYSDADGLHVGAITALFVRGGRVWVGGELGVMVLEGDRFRAVTATEMLRGITGIVETADGDLWINGAGGVTHVTAAELRRALESPGYRARAERFDHHDGLNGPPVQVRPFPTAIQGTDGRLWFATESGVAWLDPKNIRRNTLPPPVQIRAVSAAGRSYDADSRVGLPRGIADIRIAFAAASLAMPDRVRFRYRLVGLDSAWVEAGSRREAYYTNLRPGSYRFQVTAANEDGLWNEAGASVGFAIRAAFIQTKAFLFLLAGVAATATWLLAQWRQRRIVRALRTELEATLAEETRVARERHDKLVSDMSGVATQLSAGARRATTTGASAAVVDLLSMLSAQVQRSLVEAKRSMTSVRTSPEKLPPLHEQLADAAQRTFAETSIAAHVEPMGSPRQYPPTVETEIVGIATEAMSNARQHTGCQKVTVTCSYAPRELRVRIHDDGRGFDPSQGTPLGQWGLFAMRQRAATIGAQVSVTSAPAAGTEVVLVVPGGPGRWTWWGRPVPGDGRGAR